MCTCQIKIWIFYNTLTDSQSFLCDVDIYFNSIALQPIKLLVAWILNSFYFSEKNNVDVGVNISGELDSLKKNLDKYKKSGMGEDFEDVDIQTLDWVEDNRKVKAFFIYESSL